MAICDYWGGCIFDALPGRDKCIFHLDVDSPNKTDFKKHLASYLAAIDEIKRWKLRKAWVNILKESALVNEYKVKITNSPRDSYYNFTGFIFPENTDFLKAHFQGQIRFDFAIFKGDVTFEGAFIDNDDKDEATFEGTEFEGDVSFVKTDFSDVTFLRAKFKNNVRFNDATLNGITNFASTELLGRSEFINTHFSNMVLFLRTKVANCIFQNVDIDTNSRLLYWACEPLNERDCLSFSDMEMSRISFLHTDIYRDMPKVRFFNVDWIREGPSGLIFDSLLVFKSPYLWLGHLIPNPSQRGKYDILAIIRSIYRIYKSEDLDTERILMSMGGVLHKRIINDVERISNDIRRYYEDYGAYPSAGDFYIREMDIRRKRLTFNPNIKSWVKVKVLSLYRLVSLYGESPGTAFAWIVGLLFILFPFAYTLSGVEVQGNEITYGQKLLWAFSDYCQNVSSFYFDFSVGQYIKDYLSCILFSMHAMIPAVRLDNCYPSTCTLGLRWFEFVLSTSLVALFLLALRRRFKR